MNVDAWLTLAVVGATVLTMARGLLPPGATLFGGMVGVLAVGVVTPEQALIGFSNPAPLTIAGLYVLARAVDRSGTLSPMVQRLLGDGSRTRRSLSGLLVPTAGASAVINNTPIVAMLVPQVERWAVRHGRSPSSYLMPLSFAAILGGLLTLVGTTTTIVVSGLMETMGPGALGILRDISGWSGHRHIGNRDHRRTGTSGDPDPTFGPRPGGYRREDVRRRHDG